MEDNRSTLTQFFVQSLPTLNVEKAIAIANTFRFATYEKGDNLVKAGDVSNDYLVLQRGIIRSYIRDTQQNDVTLNFFSPVTAVFEVASFFQRIPSLETIECITPCSGWTLTYKEINDLFHAQPEFRELGRAILVKGFIQFKQRTLSLINMQAEARYAMLMQQAPEILQSVPLKYIASYLGVTDSSLSRIRREFSKH